MKAGINEEPVSLLKWVKQGQERGSVPFIIKGAGGGVKNQTRSRQCGLTEAALSCRSLWFSSYLTTAGETTSAPWALSSLSIRKRYVGCLDFSAAPPGLIILYSVSLAPHAVDCLLLTILSLPTASFISEPSSCTLKPLVCLLSHWVSREQRDQLTQLSGRVASMVPRAG